MNLLKVFLVLFFAKFAYNIIREVVRKQKRTEPSELDNKITEFKKLCKEFKQMEKPK